MGFCTNCGHGLGVGRFCTNCGHPVGAAVRGTDTAERPAVAAAPPAAPPPPSVPPPPAAPPPPARFPLFADELGAAPDPPYGPPPAPPPVEHRQARPAWPWLAVAAAVVLVVALVVGLGLRSADTSSSATPASPVRHTAGSASPPAAADLMAGATVDVPATAPPNQDVAGNPTTYDGGNLLDGVPETCWRMPGDGTGEQITVTLPQETHLRRVGLINGYAKSAKDARGRTLDWYHGNRRVLRVEWVFDDGSTVAQDLADTTAVQSVDVDVTTTTVVLRLVEVSPPGKGRAARNYTAISDLSFVAS